MGILTEYLRTWPGVVRSNHPDGSFAAVGALAGELMREHPLNHALGEGSPLERFLEHGLTPWDRFQREIRHCNDLIYRQIAERRAPRQRGGLTTVVFCQHSSVDLPRAEGVPAGQLHGFFRSKKELL